MSESNNRNDDGGCCCLLIVIVMMFFIMGGKISISVNNAPTNIAPVVSMSLEQK